MKKYHITTFGCQMNVHESEKIAGILEHMNYENTEKIEDADIVVFNTCAVRENAENRAEGNIGNLKQLKKKKPNMIIVVAGCMTQQREIEEEIFKTFSFVDIVLGTHDIDDLEKLINDRIEKNKRIKSHVDDKSDIWENHPLKRTSGRNAWVNIMFGCDNFCSYCVVPYVRGREKSRKKEEILREISEIAKSGQYDTITLLGQNVNSYGKKIYEDYFFPDLLDDICKIEGNFKISFMSSHPKDLSDRLIEVMAKNEKVSKELHLPIQSGSDRILKDMNRHYTTKDYLLIVKKLRKQIPGVRLTTDFIVGFPGETKSDFEKSLKIIKKVKFDSLFGFIYSPRLGTRAEKMENQIPEDEKNRRVNKLLSLEKRIQEKQRKKQ